MIKLQELLLDELKESKDKSGLTLKGDNYDNDLYVSMKGFWDQFTMELTHDITCATCENTTRSQEVMNCLLLQFPEAHQHSDKDITFDKLMDYHLEEEFLEPYQCGSCKTTSSATKKSSITKFPSFVCVYLCRRRNDNKSTISSAVDFPVLGFWLEGGHTPYDLSATVHHKPKKSGNGHYTAISRSRNVQSQEWFTYDDDRVSTSNFTKTHRKHTMVKKEYMKTATILFYVSPSIETRIKKATTIDLMEGNKEPAQVATAIQTNSVVNLCDEEDKATTTRPANTTPTKDITKKKKNTKKKKKTKKKRKKKNVKKTHEGNTALRKGKKKADSEGAKETVGIDVDGKITNRWLELYEKHDRPVSIQDIQKANDRSMFPIIYCTNNKDINDDGNWAPGILSKVSKSQFEVLDVNGDTKVEKDIEWEGDEGLFSTWTMYHKYPSTTFVDSFRARLGMAAENDAKDDDEDEKRESGKVDSSSGKESTGSSDSSSTSDSSSDSSSSTTNSSDSS